MALLLSGWHARATSGLWRWVARVAAGSARNTPTDLWTVPLTGKPDLSLKENAVAAGPEALLVGKIRKAITDRHPDAMVWKTHGSAFSTAGMPDLFVLLKGHLIGLEVKAPREKESDASVLARVTPIQLERLRQLRNAGAIAEAVWSVEQAADVVARYVPDSQTREDQSRDQRLYALAHAEDTLRKSIEAMEGELQELRLENDRLRKGRPSE